MGGRGGRQNAGGGCLRRASRHGRRLTGSTFGGVEPDPQRLAPESYGPKVPVGDVAAARSSPGTGGPSGRPHPQGRRGPACGQGLARCSDRSLVTVRPPPTAATPRPRPSPMGEPLPGRQLGSSGTESHLPRRGARCCRSCVDLERPCAQPVIVQRGGPAQEVGCATSVRGPASTTADRPRALSPRHEPSAASQAARTASSTRST